MTIDGLTWLTPAIEEILQDGQWHKLRELMPLAFRIPPEIAAKVYRQRSKASVNKLAVTPIEEQVSKGQRLLITKRLGDLRKVEVRMGEDLEQEYRRSSVPDIMECLRKLLLTGHVHLVLGLDGNHIVVEDVKHVPSSCDGNV